MNTFKNNQSKILEEHIFKKICQGVEFIKFTLEEKIAFQESLKYYRDLKNVVDTSREEGMREGMREGMKKRNIEIAQQMKAANFSNEQITKITGLNIEFIKNI